jgi:DnaJ-domain-containing protein 1
MQEYHPDKAAALGPKLRALAKEEAQRINDAYRILSKPHGVV